MSNCNMSTQIKILAIDDDQSNLMVVKEVLKSRYDVTTSSSPLDWECLLEESEADILLLDISMPEISGYDVCQEIRRSGKFPDLKILFLSALDDVESRLQGYDVGSEGYIIKPFNYKELIAKINVILRLSRQGKSRSIQDELKNTDISVSSQFKKISRYVNSILYIHAESPYCKVICRKGEEEPLMVRSSLKVMEASLKNEKLVRVHRSYLVNQDKIIGIERKGVQDLEVNLIDNDDKHVQIPVGRKYQDYLKKNFSGYFN